MKAFFKFTMRIIHFLGLLLHRAVRMRALRKKTHKTLQEKSLTSCEVSTSKEVEYEEVLSEFSSSRNSRSKH